jgi:glyoxylase-like metal-dependent hydrolase (beta-lactamase superfamily II)/rhodanese-related sulfurtransferase
MEVKQFFDENLSIYSYAVVNDDMMVVIDPERDPQKYYDFAALSKAAIIGIIETHPHADFVSSHLEISLTTGAKIFTSKLTGAEYDHITFDDGDVLELNDITLHAINTPGHSPDSISVILKDETGTDRYLFSGDTLFVGDVGRPDLRESAGNIKAAREDLAKAMYNTIRKKLIDLPQDLIVDPGHGAGSLCGKTTSKESFTTIGNELKNNPALQPMEENAFVEMILKDQSFVPKYFAYAVELNKTGAPYMEESIREVKKILNPAKIDRNILIIDIRPSVDFQDEHLPDSISIPAGKKSKFETWLGSVISPGEKFYLTGDTFDDLEEALKRVAKIGYEVNVAGYFECPLKGLIQSDEFNREEFEYNKDAFTILDVRNPVELKKSKPFASSIHIPLFELRERLHEIPLSGEKPVVVHCAAGYRSNIAVSIIKRELLRHNSPAKVYDYGTAIKELV